MYSYAYDSKTGGILLNSTPTGFSKEPRPVYASELDLLGFDKYWKYGKQSESPYMWAEANQYYYRGSLVAKLKGGNIFKAPEILIPTDENGNQVMPEPNGTPLRPINIEAMIEANAEILLLIEQTTVKKIIDIFKRNRNKIDCFHVAFSGGKDSQVLLDLVAKTLPKGSFVVVFGDTGMEFPDTYNVVEKTKAICAKESMAFHTARSHIEPQFSWDMFGPPSRVLRWCCYVHKSAPQTLKMREVTGKQDYKGLAFVGVRSHESATRAGYDYFNEGKKTKGQLSHNPILEWTSAEVWLYIYANNVLINAAYKKGNSRVGCLFCPLRDGKARYIECNNYPEKVQVYMDIVKKANGERNIDIKDYILSEGWNARKNGRDLSNNPNRCLEEVQSGFLNVEVTKPLSYWKEWSKTLPIDKGYYSIKIENDGFSAKLEELIFKKTPSHGKLFRQVARKSAYCRNCGVCEANCSKGAIRFIDDKVSIDNCVQCGECHDVDSGCLLFQSLRHPPGGGLKMKSLNTFSDHAPKQAWFENFFDKKEDFFDDHGLGGPQLQFFDRFLRDAGLTEKKKTTPFFELIHKIGWKTSTALGLMLINLVSDNAQIKWYVSSFDIGHPYERDYVVEKLLADGVGPSKSGEMKAHNAILTSFGRITETSFGEVLGFGYVERSGKTISKVVRTKCATLDPRVVLYGLFKFAEGCNDYKGFTLATLLNDSIDRDGMSPTRIFGLDRDDMIPILLGLTAKYQDFINASFTHDMDKITLADGKTAQDVLDLFKEA